MIRVFAAFITMTIVSSAAAALSIETGMSEIEAFAGREIQRYLYLRTGAMAPLSADDTDRIVITRSGSARVSTLRSEHDNALDALGEQDYLLATRDEAKGRTVYIVGGGDAGILYGAYRFVEHLGVRFYLHGDVVPDTRIPLALPEVNEQGSPLFSLRGIQPFHDFPEGPDWWERENYLAIVGQLPKLRMNFIGLHTYPEHRPNAEPTVWIGHRNDVRPDGAVTASYPALYFNTAIPKAWGFQAKHTSDYACGAAALFTRDEYGAAVMDGLSPYPTTPEECNTLFNRTGAMLHDAFAFARTLHIKTCVGTETPLIIPERVRERHDDVGALYEGIFTRIARAYPIDYYWLWTPEGWTWEGTTPEETQRTIDDIRSAWAALERAGAPFQLATCGWVLGPQSDRALLDKVLPKSIPLSAISRSVGHDPIEPAFAEIADRPTWAIPWFEDDPAMTSPQLWAGRMRRDARDALAYGCSGLMGIHWRTRIIAPNAAALAQAGWVEPGPPASTHQTAPIGGMTVDSGEVDIRGTDDAPLYRTLRYRMREYRVAAPNGTYRVSVHLVEPHHNEAQKRVMSVSLQGTRVIEHLDIFAEVGKNAALVYTFDAVKVDDGVVRIGFDATLDFPAVAAITVEGQAFSTKINCGGGAYADFVADPPAVDEFSPVDDFYLDWALHEFGPAAGPDAAEIFARMDGKLPRSSDWLEGPGGYAPDPRPWNEVAPEYDFVDAFRALHDRTMGAGERGRYDYWRATFDFLRASARMRCAYGAFNETMKRLEQEPSQDAQRDLARREALPLRIELIRATEEAYAHLLATVETTGEMGTVANLEQHTFPAMLDAPGLRLAELLEVPLPPEANLCEDYSGPARIIVPAIQTAIPAGDTLDLRVIVLDAAPPQSGAIHVRPIGEGEYARIPLGHVARNTLHASVKDGRFRDASMEYYIEVVTAGGNVLRWPDTAPTINQTVVRGPGR